MDGLFDAGIPLGFGMALAQNEKALEYFSRLDPEQKKRVIDGTHTIGSKKEMRSYVDDLGSRSVM
ncbi:MAG: hypothetical protein GXX89_08850 [Clostridiales bacterium]|nr:hypothetical protein [Clostridiales bacterium]